MKCSPPEVEGSLFSLYEKISSKKMSSIKKPEKIIRVCALMLDPYDTTPGQRFRIEQWEPHLKQNGIVIDHFSFTDEDLRKVLYREGHYAAKVKGMAKAFFRRIGHIFKSSEYDVIYLYRTATMVGPPWLERILKRRKTPFILDFDDAIFITHTSKANARFGWLKFAGKTAEICSLSDTVTVGNSFLADYAGKYNDNVYVVPTGIDTSKYRLPPPKDKKDEPIIIGWTGSSTSQYQLEDFEPVLAELHKKRGDDIEIRVISDREPAFETVPYVWRAWSSEKEVEETAKIDIGIMPIRDDDWSRGKCAAKALQYMSLGIPAVCSDVGANRDVINHGENGFLAKTPEEWLNFLEKLIDDSRLRAELGAAGRETIVESYSMIKCAELFEQAVRDTVRIKN